MQFNAILLFAASASVATAFSSATCLDGIKKPQAGTTITACDSVKYFSSPKCTDCKIDNKRCVSAKGLIKTDDWAKYCKEAGGSGNEGF